MLVAYFLLLASYWHVDNFSNRRALPTRATCRPVPLATIQERPRHKASPHTAGSAERKTPERTISL
jgi:hypothetical protein